MMNVRLSDVPIPCSGYLRIVKENELRPL